ncbi:unnamed protein product [Debaryomyces tyrocola]|nr:unnamed protein product [Debaryomyces tyrocola]
MSMIEDQDVPGRSRERALEGYGNISGRSSSTHNTLDGDREKSRMRRIPKTVQAVLHRNKPTNVINEDNIMQEHVNNDGINLSREKLSSISPGIGLPPDQHCYQYADENHNIRPRFKRSKSSRKRRPIQRQRLNLNYGNEGLVHSNMENSSPLETLSKKIEEPNGHERFYNYGNPDNSFRGLQSNESEIINNVHSDLSYRTTATTPSSVIASAANKIYNRMSQLFKDESNNLYSLSRVSSSYTLKGNELSEDKKSPKENDLDAIRTVDVKYESELDDEDAELDEECGPDFSQKMNSKHNTDNWSNIPDNINDTHRIDANKINYKETLQEISDFQNNFVKKYNNDIPIPIGDLGQKNTSRTLQKILDYKDLYSEEEDSSNSTSNANLSSKWRSLVPGNTSYDYGIKIQHEAIMSEYTQIKLRFSSSLSDASAETYSLPNEKVPSKLRMKSKAGVLGFVDRSRYFTMQDNHEKEQNTENLDEYTTDSTTNNYFERVDSANKDEYVSNLWNNEVDRMFPILDSDSPATTFASTPDLHPPRKMSIDLKSEDYDIYQKTPDNNHTATKSIDLSQMARNVRFRRYA